MLELGWFVKVSMNMFMLVFKYLICEKECNDIILYGILFNFILMNLLLIIKILFNI